MKTNLKLELKLVHNDQFIQNFMFLKKPIKLEVLNKELKVKIMK